MAAAYLASGLAFAITSPRLYFCAEQMRYRKVQGGIEREGHFSLCKQCHSACSIFITHLHKQSKKKKQAWYKAKTIMRPPWDLFIYLFSVNHSDVMVEAMIMFHIDSTHNQSFLRSVVYGSRSRERSFFFSFPYSYFKECEGHVWPGLDATSCCVVAVLKGLTN